MKVAVTHFVELSPGEMEQVFWTRLNQLTDGCWIREGVIQREEYTSHRFDVDVAPADAPGFEVQAAAIRLHDAIKQKKRDGAPK